MLRLQTKHERAVSDLIQVDTALFLCALSAVIGAVCGYVLAKTWGQYDFSDDPPRPPMARDVYTSGSKLVAMPRVERIIKPSSAWPWIADGIGPRRSSQRAQSQVEHGDVT